MWNISKKKYIKSLRAQVIENWIQILFSYLPDFLQNLNKLLKFSGSVLSYFQTEYNELSTAYIWDEY